MSVSELHALKYAIRNRYIDYWECGREDRWSEFVERIVEIDRLILERESDVERELRMSIERQSPTSDCIVDPDMPQHRQYISKAYNLCHINMAQ